MLTFAYYLLQVIICSGIMLLYYWLVLRNKKFHQYNRFYLLLVFILPWLVPFLKIQLNNTNETARKFAVVQFAELLADNNSYFEKTVAAKSAAINWNVLAVGFYAIVSAILFTGFCIALIKVYRLLKTNSCKNFGDVYLILTNAKGTPFSFFKYIFWNTEILLNSNAGKQMLEHELTHVQEKHSVDKIIIQLVLVIGWCNPFFWMAKREINMIHEFIADNKVIKNGDAASLAEMLMAAAFPQQRFALTNPFFFSPIKRRLAMIANNKNPKFSYARRVVVLPLLAFIVLLFAFRMKEKDSNITNVKKTTPVSIESVTETLNLKADTISTEKNNSEPKIYSNLRNKKTTDTIPQSKASSVTIFDNTGISKTYPDTTFTWKYKRTSDFSKALCVVDGKIIDTTIFSSINPADIQSIYVLKDETATKKYGDKGKNGVIEIRTKKYVDENESPEVKEIRELLKKRTEEKIALEKQLNLTQQKTKEDSFKQAGFVEHPFGNDKVFTKVIIPAEFPGGEAGWQKYLLRNLSYSSLKEANAPPGKYTVSVVFVVHSNGTLSDVNAENNPGYGTKEEAERMIKKGPKWLPAVENGYKIDSKRKVSISFFLPEKKATM